jgi:PhzF family phenazine biosynthesis protein
MRQWTIDAFAGQAFRGNPACVVEPFDAWPDDGWMQSLAMENNQAETAFLRRTDRPDAFDLRWFTPTMEVDICGHATLASGHVLMEELGLRVGSIAFATRSGELKVARLDTGYSLDLPADPPHQVEADLRLAAALGFDPVEVWAGRYLAVLAPDEGVVRRLKPDLTALSTLGGAASGGAGAIAVVALAGSDKPYQIVSRFFAPGCGIPEDPATGSLHCLLAPLFSERLGQTTLHYHQAYPGRGGDLTCTVAGDRVLVGGQAVTVLESRLRV